MSLKIRLRRMGTKKKPFYRLVAIDSRMARDGRFVEVVGYYDPMTNPPKIQIDEEALFRWIERGATPSVNVASLLRRVGSLQKWDLMKAGVKGEELETRVEAIKNQQLVAAERRETKKREAKTRKEGAKPVAEGAKAGGAEGAAPEAPKPEASAAES
jgi:small subunit ribosomal protein S16